MKSAKRFLHRMKRNLFLFLASRLHLRLLRRNQIKTSLRTEPMNQIFSEAKPKKKELPKILTPKEKEMKQVHIVLQGKGGVGKSVVAAMIAQYLKEQTAPVIAIDTDPNNATLSGYKALKAQRLVVMENGSIIERNFDTLVEQILNEKDANFVIDNGSANFSPFKGYLISNDIIRIMADHGKQVYIHTVIKGGQEIMMPLAGFDILAEQMPEQAKLVVWLNEFIGEVKGGGKGFEEMKVYKKNKGRVNGIVRLEHESSTLHGQDIRRMLDSSLTFDEVATSPDFGLIVKSRLKNVKEGIFDQQ